MEDFEQELPQESLARRQDGLDVVETTSAAEAEGLQHLCVDVRRALPDRRIDKYLAGRLGKSVSRTAMQRYIREGMVTVTDRVVKPSYVIRTADVIDMLLPEDRLQEIPPEPIPLEIVYEDDDVLAINKQADLVVHPARGNWTGTLVNGLAYYFSRKWRPDGPVGRIAPPRQPVELPVSGEAFRPGIVHRLDRDTTGIMLVAKTQLALWRLGRQFELRKIQKTYVAIVHGLLDRDQDIIDVPIGKHPKVREKFAVHRQRGQGLPQEPPGTAKQAVTRYTVLQRIGPVGGSQATFTLVSLRLITGRTHQLRVHMSFIGHPIVGDKTYGGGPIYRSQLEGDAEHAVGPLIERQALHAHTIEFRHPRTNKSMKLEAPLPKDFTDTLEQLQRLSQAV